MPQKEKWIPQRGDCFSRFRPLPRRLHALVAARRLKAVASAHAPLLVLLAPLLPAPLLPIPLFRCRQLHRRLLRIIAS